MNTDQFLATCKQLFDDCNATLIKKNADYTDTDPFSNFYAPELGLTTEQSILYMIKLKYNRISNLIINNKSPNFESIDDTIRDMVNYLVILYAYSHNENK